MSASTAVFHVIRVHRGSMGNGTKWAKLALHDSNTEPQIGGDYERLGVPSADISCAWEVFDEMVGIAPQLPCQCEFEVSHRMKGGEVVMTVTKFVRPVSGPGMQPKSPNKIAAE